MRGGAEARGGEGRREQGGKPTGGKKKRRCVDFPFVKNNKKKQGHWLLSCMRRISLSLLPAPSLITIPAAKLRACVRERAKGGGPGRPV